MCCLASQAPVIDHSVYGTQEYGEMSGKKEERAQLIRRGLRTVDELDGVPLLDRDGVCLLTSTASAPRDAVLLARALTESKLPSRQDLARLLGARRVVRVDVANVRRWHKAVTGLESRRDIRRLLREGVPALRKLTLEDVKARIARSHVRLERITSTFESAEPAAKCHGSKLSESLDVETLVAALPARLHALADWHHDPLELLLDAGSDADRALHGLATTTADSSVASLAATLLGLRHRVTVRGQGGVKGAPEALSPALHPAYRAGRSGPRLSPALVALAVDGGTSLDRLPGRLPEAVAGRLGRLAERVAVLYGLDAALEILRALTLRWQESEPPATRSKRSTASARRARAAGTTSSISLRSMQIERAQLALSLTHPGLDLAAPAGSSAARIERLCHLAAWLDAPRLQELWPRFVALNDEDLDYLPIGFLQSAPAHLAGRALELGVADQAADLKRSVLERYLTTVAALREMQLQNLARQHWFLDLFQRGGAPATALTLALVSSIGRRDTLDGRLASLHALSRGFKSHGPLLQRALRAWNTTTVEAPPPELTALAEALEMSAEPLERYLHFKRLAGGGESFSNELLELLGFERKQESEIAHLEARLADADLPQEERTSIELRLLVLKDPDSQRGRRRKAVRRARNRLERALALYRSQSLERTLTDVYCRLLSRLLGEKVPREAMRPGMRESLQLMSSDNRNWHLFIELLRDSVRGRRLEDRAPNRKWLDRAERAGMNVDAWLRGLQATVEIGGESVRFASERDPFEIMKMGSYFDTCLSLEREDQALAASVVVNTLDVNKQVIYGRRKDGTVVARKLIGATAAGELAGYNTYVSYNRERTAAALATVLADYARSCGLRLSDMATPELLHDGFWYDDGNEPWGEFAESDGEQ
jgi:hypothetical protein